jgi:hypothetical protein
VSVRALAALREGRTEPAAAEADAGFTALGASRLLSAFEEQWNGDA